MVKLLKRNTRIESKLPKKVIIFGQEVPVNIIYRKIKNPELDLVGNCINVYLPNKYKRNGSVEIINIALNKMYDEIARIEIENVMEETRVKLKGLAPENYEIKRIKGRFATTTLNKTIIINPEIIKYDKKVLQYVVLHEFCHLKYKTHSKGFYNMMAEYMYDYEDFGYILNVA